MSKRDENKKTRSFSSALFAGLFGRKKDLDIFEEEEIQSPFRTVVTTYRENTIAMIALIVFILIFLTVSIGPVIHPIKLSFSETSQQNIAPGRDMMKLPNDFKNNIKDLDVGSTFTVAVNNQGKLDVWGRAQKSSIINMKDDIPKDLGKVEKVAAGFDHAIALTADGKIKGWGSNRQRQTSVPPELTKVNPKDVKDLYAEYQNSVVLMNDGTMYYFGNSMNNDYKSDHDYQGKLDKVSLLADAVIGLTKDGKVVYLGSATNSYSRVPENMGKVVDIATSATIITAVNDKGEIFTWGNAGAKPEVEQPELEGEKIVKLSAGRHHFTGITDKGNVYSWGSNNYGQSDVPAGLKGKKVEHVYSDFYQNYAVAEDGSVETWGLKGYPLGSDDLGRDIFGRLLNGGRMSMTIGAIAVVISTIIGVIVGGISGYFGGTIDNILQRLSEMVASLPFLPFAMILSSLIGNSMPTKQKTFMLMVILGLLSWTGLQRLVRAQVLAVREEEYVVAAKAVGIKRGQIIFRHILPNVISVVIVSATLSFGSSMLTEATLSYLGFGVQAPQPTWGNMLFGANDSIVIQNYWWRWVYASIVLGVCVICINLIGEGLRDAIDPKSRER